MQGGEQEGHRGGVSGGKGFKKQMTQVVKLRGAMTSTSTHKGTMFR